MKFQLIKHFSKSLIWHSGLGVALRSIFKLIQWVQCSREHWTHERFMSTKPVGVIHSNGASAPCFTKENFLNRITKVKCWMCISLATGLLYSIHELFVLQSVLFYFIFKAIYVCKLTCFTFILSYYKAW